VTKTRRSGAFRSRSWRWTGLYSRPSQGNSLSRLGRDLLLSAASSYCDSPLRHLNALTVWGGTAVRQSHL
jgi:hypothetical protein